MNNEPVALVNAINTAIGLTIAVAVALGMDAELGVALSAALAAWVLVGNLWLVRPKVASPLTQENLQKELAEAKAKGN